MATCHFRIVCVAKWVLFAAALVYARSGQSGTTSLKSRPSLIHSSGREMGSLAHRVQWYRTHGPFGSKPEQLEEIMKVQVRQFDRHFPEYSGWRE